MKLFDIKIVSDLPEYRKRYSAKGKFLNEEFEIKFSVEKTAMGFSIIEVENKKELNYPLLPIIREIEKLELN